MRAITDLLVELVAERGGQGLIVGAPAVSDALTQGTPTAGYSLVSRDVVADCFEIGHYAHHGDAMIVISGCDKTGAAALMPLARTNAFGLVLYPGTSSPGRGRFEPWAGKGTNLTIMDYAEGRAAHEAGRISAERAARARAQRDAGQRHLRGDVHRQHHEHDRRVDRHDAAARRLASGRLRRRQRHPRRRARAGARASVDALYRLIAAGIRPRDIMTERAFENAIATVYAMGGSTNMYLHLLAIAPRGRGADHHRAHPGRSASACR